MRKSVGGFATALVLSTALGGAGPVAAETDEGVLKYRQGVMKAIGGHTGAIAQIAKGNANQAGSIAIHTQGLHALSTLVAEAFRANVSEGKTRAKPEIWSDWSGFESKPAT